MPILFRLSNNYYLCKEKYVSCFAHNLSLCVTKALGNETLKPLVAIIDKVKAIVAYFRHSNLAQNQLRKEQQNERKKDDTFLYLIQEVPTRWNSTFYPITG